MSKKIYITVDTECHNISKLNQYITGKTTRGIYGLEKILQLGKELNIPINVFLDIPECHPYGDDYMQTLVELIEKYNQPICLHVHPDYIADPQRKHLWEYTKDEQRDILRQAIKDYIRFCGKKEKLFFRAGAWGVNSETYEILSELKNEFGFSEVIDLSYMYKSRWRCHLSYDEYGACNAGKKYKDVSVFPNTTYIGFEYFGRVMTSSLNVPNPNYSLFKKIINRNILHNITFTMHSWDFIKKWFFMQNHIAGDKRIIQKFKKCINYARKKGYEFDDLNNFVMVNEEDQCINLCQGWLGKISCIWYQYRSFALIGRSYKKYAVLYFSPLIILLILMVICLIVFFG